MQHIYLDNNATTHIDPLVANRLHELYGQSLANPASQHRLGRQALGLLEAAKTDLIEFVDAPRNGMETAQVVLTSGGTEANNLAIHSLCRNRPGPVIVGATEHPSVLTAAEHPLLCGHPIRRLRVDDRGQHDLEQLYDWLRLGPVSLVSIMHGNNETGVLHDLPRICELSQAAGVPVHSDVCQSVGKLPLSMRDLGLSAVSLTAHKLHGPVGVGALILLNEFSVEPLMIGGGQQVGMRAGTEPVVLAVAFALALRHVDAARRAGEYDAVAKLRNRFEEALRDRVGVRVVADGAPRLPHTSNVAFAGLDRQALQMALDLAGLACSTGSACASGSGRPSPVLMAMGLPANVVNSCLRFSFSRYSTAAEVESAIDIIDNVVAKIRRQPFGITH